MADIGLVVETPAEPAPFATGDGERTDPSSSPREAVSEDLSSGEEQSAAAALLGLHTAWPSSPDDESRDDGSEEHNPEGVAADLWDAAQTVCHPYDSPFGEPYSPKNFRHHLDYDTPGYPSPKRMRAPKDGTPDTLPAFYLPPCLPRPPSPVYKDWTGRPHAHAVRPSPFLLICLCLSSLAGAPPPGTSRFRCKFPGCSKLYASTDAVRKHCRKRHLEWLRQIDRYSAHERGTPKPALYCVWGDEDTEDM